MPIYRKYKIKCINIYINKTNKTKLDVVSLWAPGYCIIIDTNSTKMIKL